MIEAFHPACAITYRSANMRPLPYILTALVSASVSMASPYVPSGDGSPGFHFWRQLDELGIDSSEPKALLSYLEPMIAPHSQNGEDPGPRHRDKEQLLKTIEANLNHKNALRQQLLEQARLAEGDFTNPLLDAQVELHMLRAIWRSNSPTIAQQLAKIADLEETLTPVPPEERLADIWRRMVLSSGDRDLGTVDPLDTRFKAIHPDSKLLSLRIDGLRAQLPGVRQALEMHDKR